MHLTSQFQLLLQGHMDFPKSTMKLRSISVHYTDHNFPYGPFAVRGGHDMLVLHPRQGGLVTMADRDARRQINLKGRHLYGSASEAEWQLQPEFDLARVKPLITAGAGPYALMIDCPPRSVVTLPEAAYGRYEIVLSGLAALSGRRLIPPAFRYVRECQRGDFVEAGPNGAIVMLLAFDRDAREGGLKDDRLSAAAAAAMERAI
jgi:hypothetical protein